MVTLSKKLSIVIILFALLSQAIVSGKASKSVSQSSTVGTVGDILNLAYKPESIVTYEQAISLLSKYLTIDLLKSKNSPLNGQQPSGWARDYLLSAAGQGLLPAPLPTLKQKASKSTLIELFLSFTGFGIYELPIEKTQIHLPDSFAEINDIYSYDKLDNVNTSSVANANQVTDISINTFYARNSLHTTKSLSLLDKINQIYSVYTFDAKEEKQALDAIKSSIGYKTGVISENKTSLLNQPATKKDITALLKAHKYKLLGWYGMLPAWKFYSERYTNPELALYIFRLFALSGKTAGISDNDRANALFGYGAVNADNRMRNFYTAFNAYKQAIKISPKSKIAVNATESITKMPPYQLGYDYKPESLMTYEDLMAMLVYHAFYRTAIVPDGYRKYDTNGKPPSGWSMKYVSYSLYKNLIPSIPSSFTEKVPRYWAASFMARMKFFDTYEYERFINLNDMSEIPVDDRMYINIAIDRSLFPKPQGSEFKPFASMKRADIKDLVKRILSPGQPGKTEFKKTSHKKVVSALYCDNGLLHLSYQNQLIEKYAGFNDFINFHTVYNYNDNDMNRHIFNSKKYKDEGTKYIRTRFQLTDEVREGIRTARENKLKCFLGLFADGVKAIDMISSKETRKIIADDLVHLTLLYDMAGVNIDFEHMPPSARNDFSEFIIELSLKLHAVKKLLTVDTGGYSSDRTEVKSVFDLDVIGKYSDYVMLILYDNYPAKNYKYNGVSGPVSEIDRNEKILKYSVLKIPPEKILLGIGAYGLDFDLTGKKDALAIALENIEHYINQNAIKETVKHSFDQKSGSPFIEYRDKNNHLRRLWYENYESFSLRMNQVHKYKLGGIFYYWLGSNAKALYKAIERDLR